MNNYDKIKWGGIFGKNGAPHSSESMTAEL